MISTSVTFVPFGGPPKLLPFDMVLESSTAREVKVQSTRANCLCVKLLHQDQEGGMSGGAYVLGAKQDQLQLVHERIANVEIPISRSWEERWNQ